MRSIYDLDRASLSKKELAEAERDAVIHLRLWSRRAVYWTAAFLLSCASVIPFLYGHSLHVYWESFGKYLIFLSMALLIPCGISVTTAINSWFFLRALKEGKLY